MRCRCCSTAAASGSSRRSSTELNNAFGGREDEVRSVLTQIRTSSWASSTRTRQAIVAAIENAQPAGARSCSKQDGTIKTALDDMPGALRSINSQRADLVKMLKALDRLSGVGVRVIQASKESTINSLRDLAPVLDGSPRRATNFPKSLPGVPDLPVRRRGRRSRPAGRAQPAHG